MEYLEDINLTLTNLCYITFLYPRIKILFGGYQKMKTLLIVVVVIAILLGITSLSIKKEKSDENHAHEEHSHTNDEPNQNHANEEHSHTHNELDQSHEGEANTVIKEDVNIEVATKKVSEYLNESSDLNAKDYEISSIKREQNKATWTIILKNGNILVYNEKTDKVTPM